MVSGIVLAAGLSTRFGSPKALADIHGKPAIAFLLEKLIQTKLSKIIIVLGANSEEIQPFIFKHTMIQVVYNKHYKFGQTSSVQSGLNLLSARSNGFMLLPVDGPFVKVSTIDSLIDHFMMHRPSILIPAFENRKGHPPVIDTKFKEQIQRLDHSQGINSIFQTHTKEIQTLEFQDPGVRQTFNTPEELSRIIKTPNV